MLNNIETQSQSQNQNKKVILCILDGWGYSKKTQNNAWHKAHTPTFDSLFTNYPHTLLQASGSYVGLPEQQMGNSEVGHMIIGSGRILKQGIQIINDAISDSTFYNNKIFTNIVEKIQKIKFNNKADNKAVSTLNNIDTATNGCHILGLLSDGGVHSHIDHIIATIKALRQNSLTIKIYLHIITDGRDCSPRSAMLYIKKIFDYITNTKDKNTMIATICGRYYAMDRDNRDDRTQIAYDAIVLGKSEFFFGGSDELGVVDEFNKNEYIDMNNIESINKLIMDNYNNGITDEFFKPICNIKYNNMNNDDGIIVTNFRADRVRQILKKLLHGECKLSTCVGMSNYSEEIDKKIQILFPSEVIQNTLSEILELNNKTQLKIAETEKYAHVTFFFNGGLEKPFLHEDRIMIPSQKIATYDQKPEMSAKEITDKLIAAIIAKKYDFICVNYANTDMVGHTGNIVAATKACEVVDACIGSVIDLIKMLDNDTKNEIVLLITSDHGNVEEMYNNEDNDVHTAHTNNPVPFIYIDFDKSNNNTNNSNNISNVSNNIKLKQDKNLTLADIMPTILYIMNIQKINNIILSDI